MPVRTQIVPKQPDLLNEQLDEQDRSKIHDIIAELRRTYVERLDEAVLAHNQAQRQVNRASHEVSRIERHLERINDFCIKNNIPLDEQGE